MICGLSWFLLHERNGGAHIFHFSDNGSGFFREDNSFAHLSSFWNDAKIIYFWKIYVDDDGKFNI